MAFIQDGEIYVGLVDSLDQAAQITTDGNDGVEAWSSRYGSVEWSPDGTQLLVERWDQAYTMLPDGSGRSSLMSAFDLRRLEWHPDGTSIVYWSGGSIHIRSSDRSVLVPIDADLIDHPSWSPDGKWIVHIRTYALANKSKNGIYAVNADGSESYQLTSTGGGEATPRWH
jgi:Tol biopolymer transport system component